MNILFDHQIFSTQEYGGISRYFSELIKHINTNSEHKAYLSLLLSNNVHLREANIIKQSFFSSSSFYKKGEIMYSINNIHSIFDITVKNYDILHATNYNSYFIPYLNRKPFVVTFYDMIHEKFSGKYKELKDVSEIIIQKKTIAQKASAIISISESTKRDLVELCDINPDKIHVIHLGSSFKNIDLENSVNEINSPYILFVGKREAYKNFSIFLRAVSSLLRVNDLLLVCAGGGNFTNEETKLIDLYGVANRVVYKSITGGNLPFLYKHAVAFIFPSLYEGFGIPILEAFSCGCPCILSNTSSLPEVAGDAALYFDPSDEHSILETVKRIVNEVTLRKELIIKGYDRLTMFSWNETAGKTMDVYKNIF